MPAGTSRPPIKIGVPDPDIVGAYHVHPDQSIFSKGDVENFLSGSAGHGRLFSILASCDGSRTWALVRLKGTPTGRDALSKSRWGGPVSVVVNTDTPEEVARRAERNENRLAKDAQDVGYALYARHAAQARCHSFIIVGTWSRT